MSDPNVHDPDCPLRGQQRQLRYCSYCHTAEWSRAQERKRLREQVKALPTTRTRAWDKGWDSVSLNDVLELLGGDDE